MVRRRRTLVAVGVLSTVLIGLLLLGAPVATQEPMQGKKGGGETETAGNNLSYPVIFIDGTLTLRAPTGPLPYSLGGEYWYGWQVTNPDGTVDQLACDPGSSGCEPPVGDSTLSRIYLQKNELSAWQAANTTAPTAEAMFVDWSDNIEYQTWTTSSVIRVETVPFGSATGALGFQMWWASGKGTDEVWGARAKYDADENGLGVPVGYPFSPDYATLYTPSAHLTLQKLESGAGSLSAPPNPNLAWRATTHTWVSATVDPIVPTYTAIVYPYTAEVNVGGKAIYGFNWQVRNTTMNAGDLKDGWWRLTFSTDPNGLNGPIPITFSSATVATPPEGTASTESNIIFKPVIDTVNHITYIDIYVAGSKGGGKRVR